MRLLLPTLALLTTTLSTPLHPQLPLLSSSPQLAALHPTPPHITTALSLHDDPVAALKYLHPELADELDEPRLLQVFGGEAEWLTEGDKDRLRKAGLGFVDLTGREELVDEMRVMEKKEPHTPKLSNQAKVREVISHLDIHRLYDTVEKGTSFYNRMYKSQYGAESSRWLYNEILDIIRKAPPNVRISLESFPHSFPQSSIIARLSPSLTPRNISQPVTIIGAHQDSANYEFQLLPAPGADDDMSGSATILEAFRALVERGYDPVRGPVEFHWYAGEEGGLLGSLDVAEDYWRRGVNVGAMMEYDMTAYVKNGTTPTIALITTESSLPLTDWVALVAKEYCAIPVILAELFKGAGSDYMSFSRYGYPATFGSEADPMKGDFDPFVHTAGDRMDLKNGEFSFEHMLEFSKLTVGFVIEQAGWKASGWRD